MSLRHAVLLQVALRQCFDGRRRVSTKSLRRAICACRAVARLVCHVLTTRNLGESAPVPACQRVSFWQVLVSPQTVTLFFALRLRRKSRIMPFCAFNKRRGAAAKCALSSASWRRRNARGISNRNGSQLALPRYESVRAERAGASAQVLQYDYFLFLLRKTSS